MEKVTLWFQPGNRREGFRWSATYRDKMVGICNRSFCELCNLAEREKLRDFQGGKLEVVLILYYQPSFWEKKEYYLGHLVSIPQPEVERIETDEGIEFDVSRCNTFIYRTRQGALLIDPGWMGFGEEGFSLRQLVAGERMVATLVTHGHLDHWNRIAEVKTPVFLSQLTFQLASRHAFLQRDSQLVEILRKARTMVAYQPVLLERIPLKIDTVSLPHSIPETMGLVIKGERKRVVHLGDFKLNGMETRLKAETISLLSEIAKDKDGIDLLVLNILNAHIEGFTPLESLVIDSLTNIIAKAKNRVIINCFSTNLGRILKIAEIAQLLGKPIIFCGSGMKAARELLGLKTDLTTVEAGEAVIFVTGCQAEEYSVLWRLSKNQNPSLELRSEDTLVFSSRCIPGNETNLRQMISDLKSLVGRVIVSRGELSRLGLEDSRISEESVHVSGHGNREDIRLALEILKPRQVLPWPQISPQIEAFQEIAEPLGIEVLDDKERIIDV